jgi:RimJ/RimL family protein N-acetyltransferase
VFETSRLRLRPWRVTDAPGPGQGPDSDSLRFMPAGAQPGPDDFPAWLARRRADMDTGADLHWCIADATSDTMLGNVQIFRMGPPDGRFQGELGYWLRPGARGRAVIGEALGPVLDHAFTPVEDGGLGVVRLHAGTDSDNYASQAILRAAGFTQWGADHHAWRRTDGSLSDGAYFELLADTDRAAAAAAATALIPALLDSERLQLRAWSGDDLPRLADGLAGWVSPPVDESVAGQWLARRLARKEPQLVSWCIADKATRKAVGGIDVFDIGRPVLPGGCELGYWTHPDSRGRGIMTEALRRLLPHLLASPESGGLGLRRVTARTSELNVVSQSVLRAAGMRQWGAAARASVSPEGVEVAQVHFALLADELGRPAESAAVQWLGLEAVALEGHGVRLRQWRHTDAERVVEACNDQRTQHWLGSLPSPYTREDAHAYIETRGEEASQGKGVFWCVAETGTDVCLGSVAVMDLGGALGTVGEIGYWAHPDARGRGVMTEAVRLAVRHAFVPREEGGLGRLRLRLNAADGNMASAHIALASGFTQVGRDRSAEPLGDGVFADLVRYDLLLREWDTGGHAGGLAQAPT